jgi:rhodanese-related sulfurtransferase
MKNSLYISVSMLLLVALLTPGCWPEKKAEVTADQAAGQEIKVRLIDVNPEEVFKDAHITGAVNLALDKIEEAAKAWDKKTPIIVYCADYTCTASHGAAKKLKELGFEDVAVFAGGINEWVRLAKENKDAYPFEGQAQQEFLKKAVEKVMPKEGEVRTVSAEELAKRLVEAK